MDKSAVLYDLTQNLQGALYEVAYPRYLSRLKETDRPIPHPLMQIRRGYAESPSWMMVQAAEFHPQALTVANFRRRAVYSAGRLVYALLELLASEGWLDRRGNAYHLTASGLAIIARIMRNRTEPFADFAPIPKGEITRLAHLMRRVINASLERPSPPNIWCLYHSRRFAPDESASELAQIIQYASDFNAFRDDAHMAAQQVYHVDGHIWEGFAYIYNGRAHDATSLYQQLAYRGYAIEDWAKALDQLSHRGWLERRGINWHATEDGKNVHESIENLTNHYFYAPWDCLNATELDTMIALLQKLYDACAINAE